MNDGKASPLPWPDKLDRPDRYGRNGAVRPHATAAAAPPDDDAPLELRPWPTPSGEVAYHGPAGRIVRAINPQTEADPLGLLAQLCW